MQDEQNKSDQMSEQLLQDNTFSEEFSEKDDQSKQEEHSKTDDENVEEQLSPKKRNGKNYSQIKS